MAPPSMSRRTHHMLPNNIPLVVTEQRHLHGVCIAVAVRCGARDDSAEKWGLSHFVEHMMFRGSANHPNAAALIAPFEQAGGTLQAETWRDHTLFWTVVHPTRVEGAMAALGDMMSAPRFDDIELERLLVQAELSQDIDEDGHDVDIGAVSRRNIWGAHPMGRRIIGSPASLLRLNLNDVRRRHKNAYVAENMVLSVSGRITAKSAQASAARHFAALRRGTPLNMGKAPKLVGKRHITCPQPVPQVSLQWTFEALPDGHDDFTAQSLLVGLLDDGMGTRLHRALSERSGLVYAFSSGLDCYADCGLYDIDLQVEPRRLHQAMVETAQVLQEVANGDVTAEELQLAQQRALLAIDIGQDSAEDLAQEAAIDLLFNRPSPKAHIQAIRRTKVADITRLAKNMFVRSRRFMTLMGATDSIDAASLVRTTDAVLHGKKFKQKVAAREVSAAILAARRTRAAQCKAAMPLQ